MKRLDVTILCIVLVISTIFLLGMGMGPSGPGGQGQRGGGPMGQGQYGQGQSGQDQLFNQGMQPFNMQNQQQKPAWTHVIRLVFAIFYAVIAIMIVVYLSRIAKYLDIISRNLTAPKS